MTAADSIALLNGLAAKLNEDAIRCTDPVDREEQLAVRNMLTATADNLRAGRRGPLEAAVLEFARLGAAYFAEQAA